MARGDLLERRRDLLPLAQEDHHDLPVDRDTRPAPILQENRGHRTYFVGDRGAGKSVMCPRFYRNGFVRRSSPIVVSGPWPQ
jgi:hypothetical protein